MCSKVEQVKGGEDKLPERRMQAAKVSLPKAVLQRSVAPIVALRRGGLLDAAGQLLVFLVKLAALEAIRRGSQAKCRPIWWGLQGLSVFQAPPFSWLQRWSPFRQLAQSTQSFSKPMMFLSLATAVTTAVEEAQEDKAVVLSHILSPSEPIAMNRSNNEGSEGETPVNNQRAHTLCLLKGELGKEGIALPERINDDELERFLVAANGDVPKFVAGMRKTVRWRTTYYLLPQSELQRWEHFVFWHHRDAQRRPTIVIRLGLAYCTLDAADRPRFAQAVVSQVEYGVVNLVNEEDARLMVVMDCQGTSAIGFPVQMMKSCTVLVQENYPTRLAALFVINLPPVVHVIAQAVMQTSSRVYTLLFRALSQYVQVDPEKHAFKVVKPKTKEKVHVEGEHYMGVLAKHLGGVGSIPSYLGGSCKCLICSEMGGPEGGYNRLLAHRAELEHYDMEEEHRVRAESGYGERLTAFQSYTSMLRLVIVGLLMLWIVVAMVAGFYEPEPPPT